MGQAPDPFYGSVNMPIHMTSTYAQVDANVPYFDFDYTRGGNPTREALHKCMASLENAKYAISYSAGLSSALIITHLLKTGDHILSIDDVYGGTGRYFRRAGQEVYGIESSFVDMTNLKTFKAGFQENTKLVWIETPTNPLLKVVDIAAIAKICREKKAILVVDNTF